MTPTRLFFLGPYASCPLSPSLYTVADNPHFWGDPYQTPVRGIWRVSAKERGRSEAIRGRAERASLLGCLPLAVNHGR